MRLAPDQHLACRGARLGTRRASQRPFAAHVMTSVMSRSRTLGIHFLCMGTGFMAVTPLSMLFADGTSRWPLFPGSSLAVIGRRL
jgi:hypothetical protein